MADTFRWFRIGDEYRLFRGSKELAWVGTGYSIWWSDGGWWIYRDGQRVSGPYERNELAPAKMIARAWAKGH